MNLDAKKDQIKLLTYTGVCTNEATYSWEFWFEGKLKVSMSLSTVYQVGEREASKRFYRMVLFGHT